MAKYSRSVIVFVTVGLVTVVLSSLATAQTLTGTVKNSTTGKAAAGDEVILLSPGQSMEDVAHSRADANGSFRFKLDKQGPHIVRVIHDGVAYHAIAVSGITSVVVEVYDAAPRVHGIKVFADIMRIQPGLGVMVVTREFGVQNSSNPPHTQEKQRSLEFRVPDGAQIIDGSATPENGYAMKSIPVTQSEKNRYSFDFPIRPGLTRLVVRYRLPYIGSVNLDPGSIYPLEHFVVILPKAMRFKAVASSTYKSIHFPNQPDSIAEVASDYIEGGNLAFTISGEGMVNGERHSSGGARSVQSKDRSATRLAAPIQAPNLWLRYRWWIAGGLAAALLFAGIFIAGKQQWSLRQFRSQKPGSSLKATQKRDGDNSSQKGGLQVAYPPATEMRGIKEKLFQIEVQRGHGQISQAEYHDAKTALDQTLDRALRREARKAQQG